ncbi:Cadherin-23 [Saguinus oedipus]|uniref:Cadherin-23 n=1 Tax=Saguinus oedipus TaxID=9490 RepID=A0ABQ9UN46_SAGOE|nr:Cadherin-23 [Saguinus oedipus]
MPCIIQDQDKTRPLSTLANLAIIITDVQDMDPIFINLPYSTNIYEHSPPGNTVAWSQSLRQAEGQGTTVRIITAIDQDKGRPRGIGYTIVSGYLRTLSNSQPSTGGDWQQEHGFGPLHHLLPVSSFWCPAQELG